jgi:hypothetical protein
LRCGSEFKNAARLHSVERIAQHAWMRMAQKNGVRMHIYYDLEKLNNLKIRFLSEIKQWLFSPEIMS